jgi:hypothetical protein
MFSEEKKFVINEFLSNYSTNRNLDGVFKKWVYRQDTSNPAKTLLEWQSLFHKFMSE